MFYYVDFFNKINLIFADDITLAHMVCTCIIVEDCLLRRTFKQINSRWPLV